MDKLKIDIVSDVVCPWCVIGFINLQKAMTQLREQVEFDIMFGEGISRSGEVIDKAVDLGIIKRSGSWFSYEDTKLGQGRDAVKQMISDNPELSEEIELKIKEMEIQ